MKTMTCKQLGGACDTEFEADTFEQMGELSKQHAIEMFQKKDQPHLDAREKMVMLMQDPEAMKKWFADKRKEFDAL